MEKAAQHWLRQPKNGSRTLILRRICQQYRSRINEIHNTLLRRRCKAHQELRRLLPKWDALASMLQVSRCRNRSSQPILVCGTLSGPDMGRPIWWRANNENRSHKSSIQALISVNLSLKIHNCCLNRIKEYSPAATSSLIKTITRITMASDRAPKAYWIIQWAISTIELQWTRLLSTELRTARLDQLQAKTITWSTFMIKTEDESRLRWMPRRNSYLKRKQFRRRSKSEFRSIWSS